MKIEMEIKAAALVTVGGTDNYCVQLRASSAPETTNQPLVDHSNVQAVQFYTDPLRAEDFKIGGKIIVTVEPIDG